MPENNDYIILLDPLEKEGGFNAGARFTGTEMSYMVRLQTITPGTILIEVNTGDCLIVERYVPVFADHSSHKNASGRTDRMRLVVIEEMGDNLTALYKRYGASPQ